MPSERHVTGMVKKIPTTLCYSRSGGSIALALTFAASGACVAQTYPTKPIRVVLSLPAGSAADIVARTIGAKLTERWGQQVLIDPRPGASGIIAAELVIRAPPDGYTLMLGTSSSHAINASLYPKLPYDVMRDFAPVSLAAVMPLVLAVHPSVPARNVKDLIALAKARPGQITMASAGSGTTGHLAGELFKFMAGIDLLHVPYKGSPQALTDTVGGQVSMVFAPIPTALPQAKSARLRMLALTTPRRSATAPEVPTLAESGLPGYDATLWYGLFAPAGTPRDVVAKLSSEVATILALAEVRESLRLQGADPGGNTPEEFGVYIKSEITKWAKVVKISGARPE